MRLLLFTVLFFLGHPLNAQENPFELADESSVSGSDYTDIFPVPLNKTTYAQLKACGLLNDAQIAHILRHIQRYGGFISKYEWATVPNITRDIWQALPRYFIVHELPLDLRGSADKSTSEAFLLIQFKKRERMAYRGRIDITRGRSFVGLRFDQDAGESWHWSVSKRIWGVDHISMNYQHIFNGILKSLSVGQFQIHAGQGLVQSGAFFLGKGSIPPLPAATSYVRSRATYTENNVKHGVALEINKKRTQVIVYGSMSANDAHLYKDNSFRSLTNSGYHDTPQARFKQNRVHYYSTGYVLQREGKRGHIGTTLNIDRFSHAFHSTAAYNADLPRGKSFFQASIFGLIRRNRVVLWFENAMSHSFQNALLMGGSISWGRNSALIFSARNYGKGYHTFSGKALSESSNGHRNEQGIYAGIQINRKKRYSLYTYIDMYQFPGQSYRHNAGLRGIEWRAAFTRHVGPSLDIRIISKVERRSQAPGDASKPLHTFKQQLHLYSTAKSKSRTGLRLQYNMRYHMQAENGWLASLDKQWQWRTITWAISATYFQTSSYNTREFIYERDVWGTFSLPSYFGKGFRGLLLIKWRFRRFTTWIRTAVTSSSRTGKPSKEFKLQLKYQL